MVRRVPYECTVLYHRRIELSGAPCWRTVVHYGRHFGRDSWTHLAPLFGTLQEAIGRARKLVSLGETDDELQELLVKSRQLLAMMERHAQLAPEDTRDSLLDLCNGADRSLGKLEQTVPRDSGRD